MEIYLSFRESDLQTALHLKEDLEAYTGLFVALENEDWEDVKDFDFEDRIHQAQVLLNLESETSYITACLIDNNKPYCSRRSNTPPTNISVAPSINKANSYSAGLETLISLIAQNMDPTSPLHVSEEGYDITNDYEDKPRPFVSGQASKRSRSERAVFQTTRRPPLVEPSVSPKQIGSLRYLVAISSKKLTLDRAETLKAIPRPPLVTPEDVSPKHQYGTLRDLLFVNPKKPTLGRTEALKARRQRRTNQKSLLREARAHHLHQ